MTTKMCTICKETKPVEQFSRRKVAADGFRNQCKACVNGIAKRSRDKIVSEDKALAQERNWRRNLMRCYGMTPEEWMRMHEAQNGVCMYCKEPETLTLNGIVKRLAVDHDHTCCPDTATSCGKCVRGLSCAKCNYLVGTIENNFERISRINEVLGIV